MGNNVAGLTRVVVGDRVVIDALYVIVHTLRKFLISVVEKIFAGQGFKIL